MGETGDGPVRVSFLLEAWIAATHSWPAEAKGAYIALLAHQGLNGIVPEDREEMACIAGMPPARFEELWARRLAAKFRRVDGGWINTRMAEERWRAQKAQRAGKKGAAARHGSAGHAEDGSGDRTCDRTSDRTSDRFASSSSSSSSSSPSSSSQAEPARAHTREEPEPDPFVEALSDRFDELDGEPVTGNGSAARPAVAMSPPRTEQELGRWDEDCPEDIPRERWAGWTRSVHEHVFAHLEGFARVPHGLLLGGIHRALAQLLPAWPLDDRYSARFEVRHKRAAADPTRDVIAWLDGREEIAVREHKGPAWRKKCLLGGPLG